MGNRPQRGLPQTVGTADVIKKSAYESNSVNANSSPAEAQSSQSRDTDFGPKSEQTD